VVVANGVLTWTGTLPVTATQAITVSVAVNPACGRRQRSDQYRRSR